MGLSELLVLWIGSRDVMAGRMTVGELVAFNAYLVMLAWPMIAFGWVTNLLQRGRASWGRMLEVLETPPAIDDPAVTRPDLRPEDLAGADRAAPRCRSRYGDRSRPRRSHAADRGRPDRRHRRPTGSGKSTLLSLLARLHDPPPGTVFVDGIDVRELPLATLRGAIGFVPQEPFLFSDTIAANVAFGGPWRRQSIRPHRRAAGAGQPISDRVIAAATVAPASTRMSREFPRRLRDARRRARHHAVGRAEAARGDRARAVSRSAHPHSGRCAVGRRYADRRGDPRAAPRVQRRPHHADRLAPHLDRARRRSDPGARRRPHRRARHARRARRAGGLYARLHRQQQLEEELAAS